MPKFVTIYHQQDGTSVELPSVDASEACSNHPEEWGYTAPAAPAPAPAGDPDKTAKGKGGKADPDKTS